MQHHPDPAELMSYLLDKTQATVANDVIEHLLVCQRCIRQVNLHREFLSAEHAALRKPSTDSKNEPAFATFSRYAMQPYGGPGSNFAWALLVPLVLAVGLQSSTPHRFWPYRQHSPSTADAHVAAGRDNARQIRRRPELKRTTLRCIRCLWFVFWRAGRKFQCNVSREGSHLVHRGPRSGTLFCSSRPGTITQCSERSR